MGRKYKCIKSIEQIKKYVSYSRDLSKINDSNVYTYSFPVYKHGKKILLECRLQFDDKDNNVICNIYDLCNNNIWLGLTTEYGNYEPIRHIVLKKMKREFYKLGVKMYD